MVPMYFFKVTQKKKNFMQFHSTIENSLKQFVHFGKYVFVLETSMHVFKLFFT